MKDYIIRVADMSNETISSIRDIVRITWISDVNNCIIVEANERDIAQVKELPKVQHVEEDKCADHEV